ncbi:hypothetical protein diail_11955 [Diaporthe ilicicola]|nr:hypothetical protein diail_11955 [Diaporthe ilicicola]
MAGRGDGNKKSLSWEAQMAEAIRFQKDVNGKIDRRGGRAPAIGRTASGAPRASPRQCTPQQLATPEQFFGSSSRALPASGFRQASMPVTQHSAPNAADSIEPMQVGTHLGVRENTRSSDAATQETRGDQPKSRWGAFGDFPPNTENVGGPDPMEVDKDSLTSKQAEAPVTERGLKASAWNKPSHVTDSGAQTSTSLGAATRGIIAKNTDNHGDKMDSGKTFSGDAAAEKPTVSKGLLGSRWSSSSSPSSTFPSTKDFPPPGTLKPVYVSEDWLSDLSEENKAELLKKKKADETKLAQTSPVVQSTVQTTAQTAAPSASDAAVQRRTGNRMGQYSGETAVTSAPAQSDPSMQAGRRPVAPDAPPQGQAFGKRSVPSPTGLTGGSPMFQRTAVSSPVELSRSPASAQPVDEQLHASSRNTSAAGAFDDAAFKRWYENQFMKRKK